MRILRRKLIDELNLFGYSGMTIKNYVEAVSALARYHGKSPDSLGLDDIKTFLLYSQRRGLAPSSLRNLRCGILFFFTHVLKRDMTLDPVPSLKQESRLPMALSTSEVERLFEAVADLKHKTILMTFYATGMRLNELRLFRLENIDSERMVLKFMGKGKRERYVPLSPLLLTQLRAYWKVYKPRGYFFQSRFGRPYHRRSLQLIFEEAKQLARIHKPGGVHMLRHSYATHLFEAGVPAFLIQKLLGHQHLATTQKYVFIAKDTLTSVKSPLELLSLGCLKQGGAR